MQHQPAFVLLNASFVLLEVLTSTNECNVWRETELIIIMDIGLMSHSREEYSTCCIPKFKIASLIVLPSENKSC